MDNNLKLFIEALRKPLPEGISIVADSVSYLRPYGGSEMLNSEVPESPVLLSVCAAGRAVLAQEKNADQAWETVIEWLARDSGVSWEDHATRHLGLSKRTIFLIGENFKEVEGSFEKLAEDMEANPTDYSEAEE